ncbi:hypothetical protein AB0J83_35805 [Actinoplanes sp. NPDC049596]|uniref:hypothetical protein n=1 Tax=unclassified Actinoplanes TaxID=2626549 RepID=UPI0034494664
MAQPMQEVDIPGLTLAAATVEQSATMLDTARAAHGAQLAPGGAMVGWITEGRLAATAAIWVAHLTQLGAQVHVFAAGLGTSADEYQVIDEHVAERYRQVQPR